MDLGTPLDFYRQGTRGAFAACAASAENWQPVGVNCPSCGARYIAAISRRDPLHDAGAVSNYPDVAGQTLLAARALAADCPDHATRVRVRAFSVVA